MADQLMEVISGAKHGSCSFIHDNYIYRINKFTHKRVYLSCRLGHCRGAGKGMKGETREEIYGFKLSKAHNHPPEENKIRHFEVKEYVREEARCTQDTSKEIYERAVKLFSCYDLSRPCVDGLVKRSRDRTAGEVAEKRTVCRNVRKKDSDVGDDELIEKRLVIEQDFLRESSSSSGEDVSGDEVASYEEASKDLEGHEQVYEGIGDDHFVEVVVKEENEHAHDQHESAVEYVEVEEGVEQGLVLSPDQSRRMEKEEALSSDPDADYLESDSPDDPPGVSDSSFERATNVLVVPRKRRKRNDSHSIIVPSQRFPKQSPRVFGERRTLARGYSVKRHQTSGSEGYDPIDKHLSIEESLMKIFSSTYFSSKDNVFNLLSNPGSIPSDEEDQNTLKSTNSLNIIKSASKLCTFTAVKASQMRNLLIGQTKELHLLQDVLLEHLGNMMCFSGTDFFQKCFGKPLREAIERGKREELAKKAVWNEDEIYSRRESRNDRKQLAVALLCYSGRAYTALGELIDLPGPHIARKWATNSEGNPGFSAQPFFAIRKEVSASRSKNIFVSLSMEDVELKRQIDSSCNETFGYTDLGYGRVESDSIPEATRAVIFYATAINSHWKLPLGYCLADNLSPQVRANLISQYVSKLEFNGVKCVGVVLNNSATSTQIFEEFGVVLKGALPLGTFHTNADEKIRVSPFVDIMEVMKSVKQLWKEKRSLFTSAGDEICWSHLESIEEFISSEWGLKPGTYSIDFMKYLKFLKLKFKKDPWPFGRYCTVVMKILQKYGIHSMESAGPTMAFIERMVEITEIFTSCNRFHETKYSLTNDKDSFTAINKLIHYLENLKFPSGNSVKDEDRRMPIMNLCMNLASLKVVLRRVFSEKGIFHRLTLSCVKEFISGIRTDGELLTPYQFRKRYFSHVQNLDISPSANLIRRYQSPDRIVKKIHLDLTFFSSKHYVYLPLRSMCDQVLNFFVEKVINVWIDAVECPDCLWIMLFRMRNENSGLHDDLVRLTKLVENELCVMREIPVDVIDKKFPVFANRILNEMATFDGFKRHDHLFVSGEFGSPCHFIYFVKDFIEIYVRLRLEYLSKEVEIGISDFRESSLKYSMGNSWAY